MSDEKSIDRLPPHSEEAELGVLGCIMLQNLPHSQEQPDATAVNQGMDEAMEVLKAGAKNFYDLRHAEIYRVMLALHAERKLVDIITVHQRLKDEGLSEEMGGLGYINQIADTCNSWRGLRYYADIVSDKYLLRKLTQCCVETLQRTDDNSANVQEVFDHVQKTLMNIHAEQQTTVECSGQDFIRYAVERVENYHRGTAQMLGMSTGYEYLDKMTCGFAGGQLIVVAGRPGLGKTSIVMNIVERICVRKKTPTGVLSLEMTKEELGSRLMFQVARADYQKFRTGSMENVCIPDLTKAALDISLAPLWVDDSSALNVLQVRAKARRMVQLHGIKLLVIDYLQLMVGTRYFNNREQEVAEISAGLKALAKELNIPVMVAAQLNRDSEKDVNRKPRLSDLRESGRIEADADFVGILYKPKLTDEQLAALAAKDLDWSDKWSRVNLVIAKQRSGPTGDFELEFHKASMRFEEHHRPPPVKTEEKPKEKGKK